MIVTLLICLSSMTPAAVEQLGPDTAVVLPAEAVQTAEAALKQAKAQIGVINARFAKWLASGKGRCDSLIHRGLDASDLERITTQEFGCEMTRERRVDCLQRLVTPLWYRHALAPADDDRRRDAGLFLGQEKGRQSADIGCVDGELRGVDAGREPGGERLRLGRDPGVVAEAVEDDDDQVAGAGRPPRQLSKRYFCR